MTQSFCKSPKTIIAQFSSIYHEFLQLYIIVWAWKLHTCQTRHGRVDDWKASSVVSVLMLILRTKDSNKKYIMEFCLLFNLFVDLWGRRGALLSYRGDGLLVKINRKSGLLDLSSQPLWSSAGLAFLGRQYLHRIHIFHFAKDHRLAMSSWNRSPHPGTWTHVFRTGSQPTPSLGLEPTWLGLEPHSLPTEIIDLVSGPSEAQVLDVSLQKEFGERETGKKWIYSEKHTPQTECGLSQRVSMVSYSI